VTENSAQRLTKARIHNNIARGEIGTEIAVAISLPLTRVVPPLRVVLDADRKHERSQSLASVIKFVSAHRFVDVPHRDVLQQRRQIWHFLNAVFNNRCVGFTASKRFPAVVQTIR
jgi:hypothetical protein